MFDEFGFVIESKGRNAIIIGDKYFTPLEVVLKPGKSVDIGEKVYIGKEKREKVMSIRKRVDKERLKKIDENDFLNGLEALVKDKDEFFTNFINNAKPLTIRTHQLQHLPFVGSKTLKKILNEREKKAFESLKDIEERTEFNVIKSLAKRIYDELTNGDKIFFFVKQGVVKQKREKNVRHR